MEKENLNAIVEGWHLSFAEHVLPSQTTFAVLLAMLYFTHTTFKIGKVSIVRRPIVVKDF